MKIATPFFVKRFTAKTKKEAYTEAMQWIASNIVKGQDEDGETMFNIAEDKDTDLPTFKLTLYCMLDETERKNKFCDICRQYHKSFFINADYNCSKCNMITYMKRLDEALSIKKSYRKERLKFRLNKGNH